MKHHSLVRYAAVKDVVQIVRFNAAMALETEGKALDPTTLTKGVKAVLRDKRKGFYLVVEVDGVARACLMVTTEWSDWRNGTFWWIQSVFVEKGFRKKGLYRSMYRFLSEKALSDEDVAGIRLYVEQENMVAQKTYEKMGMQKTNYLMYEFSKTTIKEPF